MTELIPFLGSLCLAISGMTGLCLAQQRHFRQARPSSVLSAGRQNMLRWSGWTLLVCSAWPSAAALGAGTGLTLWFGALTTAALLPVLLLSYAPLWVSRLGMLALPAGLAASGLVLWTLPT